jgi:integrase
VAGQPQPGGRGALQPRHCLGHSHGPGRERPRRRQNHRSLARRAAAGEQLYDVIDRLDAIRKRGAELEDARAARRAARGSKQPTVPPTGQWSLLVSGERGGFLSYGTWRKKLAVARKASGVDLTAHELRHVAASILFAAYGESWSTWQLIKGQMGHSSTRSSERIYRHEFRGDRVAVARMLGAKISELQQITDPPSNSQEW